MRCARCSSPLVPGALFCGTCGTPAPFAAPTRQLPRIDPLTGPPPGPRSSPWSMPPPPPIWAPPPPPPAPPRRGWVLPTALGVVGLLVAAGVGAVLALGGGNGSPAADLARASGAGGSPVGSPVAGPTGPSATTAGPAATIPAPGDAPSTQAGGPVSFAEIFRRDKSGVVRIETVSCEGEGVGTGFLLSPTLVATVAHVIDTSVTIALKTDAGTTEGTVIGRDETNDLALVRSSRPITGTVFALAQRTPEIGDRVAAIGFPVGDPITLTQGGVSGLDRSIEIRGTERTGLLQTDAAVNPGNSGGPLLADDGSVVGLVDALNTEANGIAYAVASTTAKPLFDRWAAAPKPEPAATCSDASGPSAMHQPDLSVGGPSLDDTDATAIAKTFTTYFGGINSGDYKKAYAVLGTGITKDLTLADFADRTATTYDSDVKVIDASGIDADTALVALTFTSLQAPDQGPDGESCTDWSLDYTLVRDGSGWLIDGATPHEGSGHTPC